MGTTTTTTTEAPTSTVTQFGFLTLDAPFQSGLNDPNNILYKFMKSNIEKELETLLCNGLLDCSVSVTNFRPGSINCDFTVTTKGQQSTVEEMLKSKLQNLPPKIAGIDAKPGTISKDPFATTTAATTATTTTATETGIVVRFGFVTIEAPFDTDLNNPDSLIYQQMSANIKTALTELFCIERFSICAVQITGFRSGSIVANFFVALSGETSDVVQFLDMQFKSLPSSIGGSKVTPGTFSSSPTTPAPTTPAPTTKAPTTKAPTTKAPTTVAPSGCSKPNYKGDGICDDENNNEGCDFDGGDCCIPNVNKDFCTECKCLEEGCKNLEYKGDGLCDDGNNNKGCDFDGGDCCLTVVNKSFCTRCECLSPQRGRQGSLGCENPEHKGDGLCDDGNNHAGCDFDGGDCCGFNVDTSFCTECACKR